MNPLRRFFGHLAGAAGVLGIALFFLVFSCSQKLPTSPTARLAAFNPGQLNLIVVVNPGTPVSVPIGPVGDTVAFPVGSDSAYFIIPPGALDSSVALDFLAQISRTTDGLISISMYDFGPSGTQFKNSCRLVHPVKYADGTLVPFYWRNPSTGLWELKETATVQGGKVVFNVDHFSDYSAPIDGLGSGGQ